MQSGGARDVREGQGCELRVGEDHSGPQVIGSWVDMRWDRDVRLGDRTRFCSKPLTLSTSPACLHTCSFALTL